MQNFAYSSGEGIQMVYTSLIDYMAGFLDWSGTPVSGWKFDKEQNMQFHKMMLNALTVFEVRMEGSEWYDIFGDFFMQYLGDKDKRGQCFTPECVSDLCAKMLMKDNLEGVEKNDCGLFGERYIVNDMACGSGRLLLSASSYMEKRRNEYVYAIGEDIDSVCVKQTAINLAIHGYYGEVICHDTIKEPDSIRFGYIVNEGLMLTGRKGLPNLRYSVKPDDFILTKYWKSRKK